MNDMEVTRLRMSSFAEKFKSSLNKMSAKRKEGVAKEEKLALAHEHQLRAESDWNRAEIKRLEGLIRRKERKIELLKEEIVHIQAQPVHEIKHIITQYQPPGAPVEQVQPQKEETAQREQQTLDQQQQTVQPQQQQTVQPQQQQTVQPQQQTVQPQQQQPQPQQQQPVLVVQQTTVTSSVAGSIQDNLLQQPLPQQMESQQQQIPPAPPLPDDMNYLSKNQSQGLSQKEMNKTSLMSSAEDDDTYKVPIIHQ